MFGHYDLDTELSKEEVTDDLLALFPELPTRGSVRPEIAHSAQPTTDVVPLHQAFSTKKEKEKKKKSLVHGSSYLIMKTENGGSTTRGPWAEPSWR